MSLKSFLVFIAVIIITSNIFSQTHNIGNTTISFYDNSRSRNIETKIYYPSNNTGENVTIATGNFPVIVFGHGFLIGYDAYQNFWEQLVPQGYIICFPTTEMSMSPSHDSFGEDIKFVASQIQNENGNSSSILFNSVSSKTALMGHSMGGGASFLAAQNNSAITTLINFAPAETTPSAISAAANITLPSLIFSGDDDCVTPPDQNQDLMYNSLTSNCKTHISIINGGHCFFANDNFNCNLGESFCNSSLSITREQQQLISFNFLKLWLDYTLLDNQNAYIIFNDSLQSSTQTNYTQDCTPTNIKNISVKTEIKIFPNPAINKLNVQISKDNINGICEIYNPIGQKIHQSKITNTETQINISKLTKGIYLIVYSNNNNIRTVYRFIKN